LVFARNGQNILSAASDFASIWNLEAKSTMATFVSHTSTVNAAVFSPDERFVLTGGTDGVTILWDRSTARELARLVSFRDGNWAVVDPEGRYDASDPDNSPGLFWLAEGDQIIELKQLKDKFYTKGLLARIISGQFVKPVARFDQVYLPPVVQVLSITPQRAEISATNNGGGFGDVVALVNGREVPQLGARQRFDPAQPAIRMTLDLSQATLSPSGQNVFQVLVKNHDNTISSRFPGGNTFQTPARPERQPRLFVLLAGASQYPNATDLRELSWSAKDALDMKQAIEIAAKPLFKAGVEIEVLATGTNKLPTKKNLMAYLEGLAAKVHPEDVLIVYLAGHGAAAKVDGDDVYYFLTTDSRGANVADSAIALDALSSVELKTLLTRKDMPLKQVLILDTCAAGALAAQFVKLSGQRTVSPEEARVMEVLKDRSGMHILMGSAPDGLSYEASQYAQGLLTYALLLGMRTMELGESGSIDVLNWFNFAEKKVPDLAKEIGGTQRPVVSSPKGQGFPIGILKETSERLKIPLSEERPMLLPPEGGDEANGFDDLRLKRALNARLLVVSRPAARGSGFDAPRLVYVAGAADETDDLPKMIKPYLRYREENGQVIVTVLLRSQKQVIARTELRGPSGDVAALAVRIVEWIEQALVKAQ